MSTYEKLQIAMSSSGPWKSEWRGDTWYGGTIHNGHGNLICEIHMGASLAPDNAKANLFLMGMAKENAELVEVLLEFAEKHHEVCEDCEGTGKIYKHADPTSGQWVPCPISEAIRIAHSLRDVSFHGSLGEKAPNPTETGQG